MFSHIGIKDNVAAVKAAKEAIGIPEMATARLPCTDCYPTFNNR